MFAIQAVNKGPLSFCNSRSKSSVKTLEYIPGTTILGGLANIHCLLKEDKDEFARFFTKNQISFGNLYPANFNSDELKDFSRPVYPIPATARTCKRFDGFKYKDSKDDEDGHGVYDQLIQLSLFALNGQKEHRIIPKECPCCGQALSNFPGFYRKGTKWATIAKAKISKEVITQTGISRERGTAQEGILYNREVLQEGQVFWGILKCAPDLWEQFKDFLEIADEKELIYLGNNRSRGMGKIIINQKHFLELNDSPEKIKERVQQFTFRLCKEAKEAKSYYITLNHKIYFPVTLQADMILRDSSMRYLTGLKETILASLLGIKPSELDIIYQHTGTHWITGWNTFTGLPKVLELAINMGSVFLYALKKEPDEKLWEKLFDLQTKGIGERRQQGFGRFIVADPFHLEVKGL